MKNSVVFHSVITFKAISTNGTGWIGDGNVFVGPNHAVVAGTGDMLGTDNGAVFRTDDNIAGCFDILIVMHHSIVCGNERRCAIPVEHSDIDTAVSTNLFFLSLPVYSCMTGAYHRFWHSGIRYDKGDIPALLSG